VVDNCAISRRPEAYVPKAHHQRSPTTATPTPTTSLPTRRLITISDVADLLDVDVRHVRRLVHEKRIPLHQVGPPPPLRPHEIAQWIDNCRFRPTAR